MLKLKSEKRLALLVAKLKKANEETIEYAQSADDVKKDETYTVTTEDLGGGGGVSSTPVTANPNPNADTAANTAAPGANSDGHRNAVLESKPNQIDSSYQHIFTSASPTLSKTVKLIPGIYFMFADISFDLPYSDLVKKTLNCAHPQERPWLEHR
jgi:hypothetical protein